MASYYIIWADRKGVKNWSATLSLKRAQVIKKKVMKDLQYYPEQVIIAQRIE